MTLSSEEKRARLEKALERGGGTHAVGDVIDMVRAGRAQFWEKDDGCVVTVVITSPRRKEICYWLMSGALRDCLDLQADINTWAAGEGCERAIGQGRRGWGRALAPYGWREGPPSFFKPLVGVS